MVVLWCWAIKNKASLKTRLSQTFIIIALISFAYGICMELVQRDLVANRSFDVGDIIADGIGCVIGLLYSIKKFGSI